MSSDSGFYHYDIRVVDKYLIWTYFNLLLRNRTQVTDERPDPKTVFQSIREKTNPSNVKRVTGWNVTDSVTCQVKLQIPVDYLRQVVHDYEIDLDKLSSVKSGRTTRSDTVALLRLIPFSLLVDPSPLSEIFQTWKDDSHAQFITEAITENPVEFVTKVGAGVSPQTLTSWIELVKQQSHKLQLDQNVLSSVANQVAQA